MGPKCNHKDLYKIEAERVSRDGSIVDGTMEVEVERYGLYKLEQVRNRLAPGACRRRTALLTP